MVGGDAEGSREASLDGSAIGSGSEGEDSMTAGASDKTTTSGGGDDYCFPLIWMWENFTKVEKKLQVNDETITRTILLEFLKKCAGWNLIDAWPLCFIDNVSDGVFESSVLNSFSLSLENFLRMDDLRYWHPEWEIEFTDEDRDLKIDFF